MEQALCLEEGIEWLEEGCVEEDHEKRDGMKTREDVRVQVCGMPTKSVAPRPCD